MEFSAQQNKYPIKKELIVGFGGHTILNVTVPAVEVSGSAII